MGNPEGESDRRPLRPPVCSPIGNSMIPRFTGHVGRLFRPSPEAGVDTLGLTALASNVLADSRTGKNGWHDVVGLLRQSVYGCLA